MTERLPIAFLSPMLAEADMPVAWQMLATLATLVAALVAVFQFLNHTEFGKALAGAKMLSDFLLQVVNSLLQVAKVVGIGAGIILIGWVVMRIVGSGSGSASAYPSSGDAGPRPVEGSGSPPPSAPAPSPPVKVAKMKITRPVLSDPPIRNPHSAIQNGFTNSLGMKFVPVLSYQDGRKVLFSIWETRRQDYAAYAAKNSGVDDSWKAQEYKGQPIGQQDDEPVVSVSWEDATAFCAWLTKTERAAGRIGAGDAYQLPSDLEWSYAVGIGENEPKTGTPESKNAKLPGVYPWGTSYPPPAGSGNYSDATAKAKGTDFGSSIEGYNDGHATTAPVGSFKANALGIYDLGGNVWEWCQDNYSATSKSRVLRGGSWDFYDGGGLLSSYRDYGAPGGRDYYYGFRCVVVVGSSPP